MAFDRDMAKLTLELSRLAYRTEQDATAGTTESGLGDFAYFDAGLSTQAFAVTDAVTRFLAFRGTESTNPRDWAVDARFQPIRSSLGRVHSGFAAALDEVWPEVVAAVEVDERPLVIMGHSLGGGLAILAAARLAEQGTPPAAVYVFGCPRPGLADFRDAYDAQLRAVTYRIINHIDIVTRVPFLTQGYRAPGLRMYFDKSGAFHEDAGAWQIIKEDLIYRATHFRRIEAIGLSTHEIGAYRSRVNSL